MAEKGCNLYMRGAVYHDQNNGDCIPGVYTGTVCRQVLLAWQECTTGFSEDVHILLDTTLKEQTQEEREKNVTQFLHFLREYCYAC